MNRMLFLALLAVTSIFGCSRSSGYSTAWKRQLPSSAQCVVGDEGNIAFINSISILVLDSGGKDLWRSANPFVSQRETVEYKLVGDKLIALSSNSLLCLEQGKTLWNISLTAGDKPHWHFVNDLRANKITIARARLTPEPGTLLEFSLDGKKLGSTKLPGYFGFTPALIDRQGQIYYAQMKAQSYDGRNLTDLEPQDKIVCLAADGTELWRFPGEFAVAYEKLTLLPNGSAAFVNPRGLHVIDSRGNLVARDSSLREWYGRVLLSPSNRVYATVADGVVEIDQLGKVLNRCELWNNAGLAGAAMMGNGDLVIGVGQKTIKGRAEMELSKAQGDKEPSVTLLREGNTSWEAVCLSPELKVRWRRRVDDMYTPAAYSLPDGKVLLRTGGGSFECLKQKR